MDSGWAGNRDLATVDYLSFRLRHDPPKEAIARVCARLVSDVHEQPA